MTQMQLVHPIVRIEITRTETGQYKVEFDSADLYFPVPEDADTPHEYRANQVNKQVYFFDTKPALMVQETEVDYDTHPITAISY